MKTPQNRPGLVNSAVSKGLETLLNQLILLDEDKGTAFEPCDEKVVQLTLPDLSITLFIIYQINADKGEFSVQTHLMGQADTHVKIRLGALFNHHAADQITGDVGLGKAFLDALYSLEIDWEEHLSHYTGDLVAFKVGHAVRSGIQAKQHAKQKVGDTFKEYLQFEVNLLPTKYQVKTFNQKVQSTVIAVESLEARIEALLSTSTH